MELPKPACGNRELHGSHEYEPYRMAEFVPCPGWTEEQAEVLRLVNVVSQFAIDHAPPLQMPPGTCLLLHPSVHYALMRNIIPDYSEFVGDTKSALPATIPVLVTTGLPEGSWQLGTFDVSDSGVIR